MNEPPSAAEEDRLAELVARCDEELAAGRPPQELDLSGLAPELRARLQGDVAAALLLRRALHAATSAQPTAATILPPATPAAGLPWTRLGRFWLRRELGRGGFGVVF